ncbi:serine hydrolase domain-containing protein [Paractinoplanes lichenicola]|uniref:Beta-lactamase family protein n=1 Tax=Paractinoplanes lichenicola TaxID=2802976 RepID=A0ABS1VUN7_9ACTN|nr:serine hydrolase domain-containing protein [Actinoplanes lichenicola]MBL7258200.1 beta-lactamase family protein [Actinoplanes lichenicola]
MSFVDGLLEEAAARHGVPGAAVAVGHGDQLLEAATGVVNRETGVETTPESVFQIGSVSKVWTTALVMQLVDDGLVELDEPVRRYLPGFAVVDPAATEQITVRQLLLHTGGFDGDLFEDMGRGDEALERYLGFLGGHAQQIAPPGRYFSYCNAGFAVLGALVARLRGGTWESVLRERLIEPLGARHMALLPEEAVLYRAAAGHLRSGAVVRPWVMTRAMGPAGSTACAAPRDLVRFGRMFLDGELLSAESIAAMTTPCLTLPGASERGDGRRALGTEIFDWAGTTAFGHDGGTVGQSTLWRVVPSHELVIAINANGGNAPGLIDDVLDGVIGELIGVTVPGRPTPPATVVRGVPVEGRFEFPLGAYDVRPVADGLEITATPLGVAAEMDEPSTRRYIPLTGDTWITTEPDDGFYSTFTFLEDGKFLYGGRIARRVGG